MKSSLRLAAAAAVLTFAPVFAAAQQGQTIAYGRTTVHYSSSFQQILSTLGAPLTHPSEKPLIEGNAVFPITEGVIDVQTGIGELASSGGNIFTAGANVIKVQNFVVDLTNPVSPVVTGVFVVNGTVLARQPIFTLQLPSGFTLPLTPQNGVEIANGFTATLAPAAVGTINGIFGGPVFQPNTPVGTLDLFGVFAATGSI